MTKQGWLVAIGALILIVAGRVFGIFELYLLAAAAGGLLLLAGVAVMLLAPRVDLTRTLRPARVHAGSPSRVDIEVTNRGRRRTPVLRLHDAVSGTRGAKLALSPLRRDVVVRAAYQLPTDRRGVLHIGPLDLEVGDPYGLFTRRREVVGISDLIVYPRIDEVFPLPMTSGADPQRGAELPSALGRSGEDFYALREYVVGDDLRRVHWPSTARHDELMVRQDEIPWFGRTTVLIDVRRSAHTPESFELVVSAAASVLSASLTRGDQVRLLTSGGADTDYGSTPGHLDSILSQLAVVSLTDDASLTEAVAHVSHSRSGGTLIVILALAAPIAIDISMSRQSGWGSTHRVLFEPSAWGSSDAPATTTGPVGSSIRVSGDRRFAETWNAAMAKGVSGTSGGFNDDLTVVAPEHTRQ